MGSSKEYNRKYNRIQRLKKVNGFVDELLKIFKIDSSFLDYVDYLRTAPLGLQLGAIEKKIAILSFYSENEKWPNRNSENKKERSLGQSFENFICKSNFTYCEKFRNIALETGRIPHNKRKHNRELRKSEIITFMLDNGHAPSDHSNSQYERATARALYNLRNDSSLISTVYTIDKCYKSGIAMRYRKLINQSINIELPLIKMTQKDLDK
jgi:hypothetical protein